MRVSKDNHAGVGEASPHAVVSAFLRAGFVDNGCGNAIYVQLYRLGQSRIVRI